MVALDFVLVGSPGTTEPAILLRSPSGCDFDYRPLHHGSLEGRDYEVGMDRKMAIDSPNYVKHLVSLARYC